MSNRKDNAILNKSFEFSVRIVNLYKYLSTDQKEYVLSKQVLRSGTSIGANIHEAVEGFSEKDFQFKLSIALKEARETEYWLNLLFRTNFIGEKEYHSINADCVELLKLLVSILKKINKKDSEKGDS